MGHSPFGPMQNVFVTVPGVTKLQKSLQIHKAQALMVLKPAYDCHHDLVVGRKYRAAAV